MSEQRLIDANALVDKIMKMPFYTWKDCENVLVEILSASTIDPVRHGKWVGLEFDGYADGFPVYDLFECSECGEEVSGEDTPWINLYCRNCGARMDKECE